MSDLELRAYDIKAGYVAWCRGEISKQQAKEAFDQFVNGIKAEAWVEGYEACAHYHSLDTEHSEPNPYQDN